MVDTPHKLIFDLGAKGWMELFDLLKHEHLLKNVG